MNGFSNWLRQMAASFMAGFRNFMSGRYGNDRLNMVILCTGLVASLISSLLKSSVLGLVFWAVSYALMIWAIFRGLSRNIYKRYQENHKFLQLVSQVKDRKNRYYDCPKCRQTVRVPRGKGKISITCPRCREKFVRKT